MSEMGDRISTANLFQGPDKVAEAALRAASRGKKRARVGFDAFFVEWLWRISPALAVNLMALATRRVRTLDLASPNDLGMVTVAVSHYYPAPPQAVWDVYTDHARWSEWAGTPGSKLVIPGQAEPNGVGAVRGFVGGMREEVLSFDAPKRMTYRVIGGFLPIRFHEGEAVLEAEGDGTRLTWSCRFQPKIPGLGGPLRWLVRKTFRQGLEGLERHSFPGTDQPTLANR